MSRNPAALGAIAGVGLLAAVGLAWMLRPAPPVEAPPAPPPVEEPAAPKGPTPSEVPASAWTTTASGLRVADVAAGAGEAAATGWVVELDYRIWREDGKLVEDTARRGRPVRFSVGKGPLVGIDEGVVGMKVGGSRQLEVPPELAYGQRGHPPDVGPDATLTLEMSLRTLLPPRQAPDAPEPFEGTLTTTESGLQIVDLVVGDGPSPSPGDKVRIEHTGWLADGTRFVSSYEDMAPTSFVVGKGQAIAAWDEAVLGMKVGGKRHIVAPWNLAYGERGRPPVVPAKATVTFQVELVGIDAHP